MYVIRNIYIIRDINKIFMKFFNIKETVRGKEETLQFQTIVKRVKYVTFIEIFENKTNLCTCLDIKEQHHI